MPPRDLEVEILGLARPLTRAERRRLAASMTTKPEILYYMAKDGDPDVRKALAANPATPNQADMILAKDPDEGVRASLTQKIAQMMPDLTEKQTTKVRAWAADTLEDMARDQAFRVRHVLADTLKDMTSAWSPASPVHGSLSRSGTSSGMDWSTVAAD